MPKHHEGTWSPLRAGGFTECRCECTDCWDDPAHTCYCTDCTEPTHKHRVHGESA